MFALCNWLFNVVTAVLIQYLFTIFQASIWFLRCCYFFYLSKSIIHHALTVYLLQTWINCSTICHQRAILSFMNSVAYLTSFGCKNAHFKSFSVLSRHRYIVCIVPCSAKGVSDLSSLKRWWFIPYIKIAEVNPNITDPLMVLQFIEQLPLPMLPRSLLSLPLFYCIGKS